LLDDELYARSLAEAAHANGRGRKRVAERLRTDGVEAEVAESALSQIFDEADDEHERAQETLYTRFPAPLSRVEQRRALAFLQRRGYGSAVAQSVVKDHAATDENDLGPNTEEALRLLRRKYPTLNPRNLQESKRAQAFLARRGCSFAIIREALRRLQD
jgi:SOS response regulatory protein OraA/RecX